jgi:hypothetical protein
MKVLKQEIKISASAIHVWNVITKPEKYSIWAAEFQVGSYFEGGWEKGDTIRFLIKNESGLTEGMVSEIAECTYPSFISIRHLGYVYNGVDDTESEEIKKWAPSYENYTLEELNESSTLFTLEMDVTDDFYNMFTTLWPKALLKLKQVAENE